MGPEVRKAGESREGPHSPGPREVARDSTLGRLGIFLRHRMAQANGAPVPVRGQRWRSDSALPSGISEPGAWHRHVGWKPEDRERAPEQLGVRPWAESGWAGERQEGALCREQRVQRVELGGGCAPPPWLRPEHLSSFHRVTSHFHSDRWPLKIHP